MSNEEIEDAAVQAQGGVFVCPRKDRALAAGELACENCDCIP